MDFDIYSFRNAELIFKHDSCYNNLWNEVYSTLINISDDELISTYNNITRKNKKSLSEPINKLIDMKLVEKGWNRQSPIFSSPEYRNDKTHWWTLDFSKEEIAVEVAFNHGEAVAWNLIKPVLSSELNHVQKEIQTSAGIIITAKNELRKDGNFDGAAGTYEKFLSYLNPFQNFLTVPMIIIGLKSPSSFYIDKGTKEIVYR